MVMVLDLNREMAWVTFLHDGWETKWHPITDATGNQLEFDSEETMNICRAHFGNVTFGIAQTSQMIINNSVRDNM
tara:strand:+ start:335 stop:559 length:225 start_codon:yes stop_codon:yes gene_type:complete